MRKQHDSISDPKYEGKRASRAQLLGDEDEGETDGEEAVDQPNGIHEDDSDAEEHVDGPGDHNEMSEEEDGMEEDDAAEGPYESEEDQESASDEEVDAHEHQSPAPETNPSAPAPQTDDLTDSLRKNREADLRKGKAVARQVVRTFL